MEINGEALFFLRERSGFTRSAFAREIESSPGYVTDLEKERRKPSPETLRKIARALHVPVTALLRRSAAA